MQQQLEAQGSVGGAAEVPKGACAWTQTVDEVEVVAPLPPGTTKKGVTVKFSTDAIIVRIAGIADALLEGKLGGAADLDGCSWNLDDGKLVVSLEKKQKGKEWPFALR